MLLEQRDSEPPHPSPNATKQTDSQGLLTQKTMNRGHS